MSSRGRSPSAWRGPTVAGGSPPRPGPRPARARTPIDERLRTAAWLRADKQLLERPCVDAPSEALEIWQRHDQPNTVAWILSQLAQDYRGALQFDDALHYSRRAIELWSAQGAEDRVASLWGEVGENLRRLGRADEAIDAFLKAEEIWRGRGDD